MIEALLIVPLIVVLIARELIALGHSPVDCRWSRVLTVIAVPLFVAFLALSVQRLLLTPPPAESAPDTSLATPAATE
jgi:hypothetical protein